MSYFTENPWPIYAILGVAAVVLVIAFFRTQRVKYLGYVGLLLVLGVSVALIDHFVETDREQVARRTFELAKAAEVGDFERFSERVSKDYYALGMNREVYLAYAKGYIMPPKQRKFQVWNMQVSDSKKAPGKELDALFSAQASGDFPYVDQPVRLELTWKKDPDNQWRVRSFRLLNAFNDAELALPTR